MRALERILARAGREEGMTMIAAIAILSVLALIVAAVMTGALSLSSTSKRDLRAKRALAGAEAGLQVARYRLNRITPPNTWCLTDRKMAVGTGGGAAGECPAFAGDLGNGVFYNYTITNTEQGAECGGDSTGTTRCITSIGMAGPGCSLTSPPANTCIKRRIQARVQHTPEQYFFPLAGIVAYDGVKLGNGTAGTPVLVNGALGSDGQIDLGNNDTVRGGCVITAGGSVHGPLSSPCPASSPNPPLPCTPATFRQCGTSIDALPWSATFNANLNTTGISLAPGSPANWSYTAGTVNSTWPTGDTRQLSTTTPPASLVLQSGDYNFCRINMANGGKLFLASPSTIVRIFIDSSHRSPSGCAVWQGTPIKIGNGGSINEAWSGNPSPQPEQVQIFVYGEPGQTKASSTADLGNAQIVNANFFGPNSLITMGNGASPTSNSIWNGAVNAQEADIGNQFTFNWDVDSANISTGVNRYGRNSWVECRSVPTTTGDPESGC